MLFLILGKEVESMKKKVMGKFVALSASILTLFAVSTAVSACTWFWYQPEEPKCLADR